MEHPEAPSLRLATGDDVARLVPMMVAFNHHEGIDWSPTSGEGPLRQLLGDPALGFIGLLTIGDETIGYGVVTYGFDLEFGGRDAFLTELYLQPAWRGRGLGRLALDRILAEARRSGVRTLHLQVRADNPTAQRLYLQAGFVADPRPLFSKDLT